MKNIQQPESNYQKQIIAAQKLFLTYDQEKIIRKFDLKADADYLYVTYIGTDYRIHRGSGLIEGKTDGETYVPCTEYTIALTICDMLCSSPEPEPYGLTGQWQPIANFAAAGSSPSADTFSKVYADKFSGRVSEVEQICTELGGRKLPRLAGADLTMEMPAFSFFPVLFQFWEGDDEFSPKILLMWDKHTLHYLRFETTYYLQGDLLEAISKRMQ